MQLDSGPSGSRLDLGRSKLCAGASARALPMEGQAPSTAESGQAVSARNAAQKLLRLCSCSACQQPLRDPVTLPCGHSTCLDCVRKATCVGLDTASVPGTSHRPTRFPLATTTVACFHAGCSRAAIGRGLGSWKGKSVVYGPDAVGRQRTRSNSNNDTDAPLPGTASPLDGFIAPLNHSLTVVPPQTARSHATEYGITKYDVQPTPISDEGALLRTDVILSKVVDLLGRYAGSLSPRTTFADGSVSAAPSTSLPWSAPARQRLTQMHRRRGTRAPFSSPHNERISTTLRNGAGRAENNLAEGSRTPINPRFLGVMGVNEDDVDSFTVGGISAIQGDDSDADVDDDDDDSIHGAFQRSPAASLQDDDSPDSSTECSRNERAQLSAAERQKHMLAKRPSEADQLTFFSLSTNGKPDDDIAYDNGPMDTDTGEAQSPTTSTSPVAFAAREGTFENLQADLIDVLECQLCYMLLHEPLTTPCGHTYCRRCFARSLDHGSSCPLCRADMPPFAFFQEHPPNQALLKILMGSSDARTTSSQEDKPPELKGEEDAWSKSVTVPGWTLKQLYEERQAAIERDERESLLSTPIFVCTLGFPTMPTILHIFEPRYRLMIRRCLESGHPRFGMVMHSQDVSGPTPGMSSYGTMLEIKTVQMLPDGRSMIETVGSSRFRVLETGGLDGYIVGRIEPVDDVPPDLEAELELASVGLLGRWSSGDDSAAQAQVEDSVRASQPTAPTSTNADPAHVRLTPAEAREAHNVFQAALGLDALAALQETGDAPLVASPALLKRTTAELVAACLGFIDTLRSGSAPWLMTRLNDTYGPMPDASDVAAFGYWMALVMPIDEHEKAKLLPIRSARLRLLVVVHWIEQLRQTWWFNHGCSVQ